MLHLKQNIARGNAHTVYQLMTFTNKTKVTSNIQTSTRN